MTRKRRAPGTGTIERMPSGLYRPRLPDRGPRLDPCATYEEAERLLNAAIVARATGQSTPVDGMTLAAWGTKVLETRELQGIRSARTDYSRWRVHVEPWHCATWPLASISRAHVQEWLDVMLTKRAAPGRGHDKKRHARKAEKLSRITVQNTLNLLRVVLQAAVERGHIDENPAAGVKLPRDTGATHEPWTYLTPEEQKAILEADAPLELRLMVAFAIGTGMRQGEQWNLRLRDVDKDAGRITIRFGSAGKPPKNGKIRRIPILPLTKWALDQWLPILKTRPNEHGLVWPLASGARRGKGKAPHGWEELLAAAGIVAEQRHDGRPVRWHDLRHTCASSLVAGWWGRAWRLEEVRDMLGHSSVTVTERYAHMAESVLEAAASETFGNPTLIPPLSPPDSRNPLFLAAPPARIELATNGLGNRCSIH